MSDRITNKGFPYRGSAVADSSVANTPGAASQRGSIYPRIKIKAVVLSVIAFAGIVPTLFVYAQEIASENGTRGITSGIRNLTDSLDLLTAIKAGKKPTDAVALQTTLNAALTLSEEEVKNLTSTLRELDVPTDAHKKTRDAFLDRLGEFSRNLKEMKVGATREESVAEIIRAAQYLKNWRDGTYAENVGLIVNFISVMQAKSAIVIANVRLISIVKDERKMRGFFFGGKTTAFLKLLKNAQGKITQAIPLATQAEKLLTAVGGDNANGDTIDALVAGTNRLIGSAYDDFLAMSRMIAK